jgi:hypothetical protein
MKKLVDGVLMDMTPEEQAEHEAAHAATMAKQARTEYAKNRAAEYPSIGDQLDALWKGGDAATAMLAQVQAVKAKYPKSE